VTELRAVEIKTQRSLWPVFDMFQPHKPGLRIDELADEPAPADTTLILVMDMYEHAYQMDHGAAAAKYIDAFFVNIHWDAVAQRL
jgi:superoxide dismutase, Fe-Mn family